MTGIDIDKDVRELSKADSFPPFYFLQASVSSASKTISALLQTKIANWSGNPSTLSAAVHEGVSLAEELFPSTAPVAQV